MKKLRKFSRNLIEILKRPEMAVLPGQLAYFFVLSLLPTLTIISYIVQIFKISIDDIIAYFNLSKELFDIIVPIFEHGTSSTVSLIILFVVGFYIISNGTDSIIVAANNIYGIEQHSFLQRRLKALIMVVILIILFLFIALVPIFGNFILSIIAKITGYNEIYNVLKFIKLPLSWLIIYFDIKVLYTIAPDKHIPTSHATRGAIFTSFFWIVATEVYVYYLRNIANLSLLYSGLANIAILLMWMYILSTIFVIGLAINYKEENSI